MAKEDEWEMEANKSCTRGVRLLIQLCVVWWGFGRVCEVHLGKR
jgi:hypothetical protein